MTITMHFNQHYSSIPFSSDDDHFHEECGVFGIFGKGDAAAVTALGLHALQHRGQEAAGIVSCDGEYFSTHTAKGLIGDNFNSSEVIKTLEGENAIGHNRYSTSGNKNHRNIQPLFAELSFGGFALAHNGNLTNAAELRYDLVNAGCLFRTTMDTEVIIHLVAMSEQRSPVDRLIDALKKVEGAYSLVALTKDCLIAARDAHGVRPLVLGKLEDSYVIASETCAFDIIGAKFIREIEAGEMILITANNQITSLRPFAEKKQKFCIFEYVYFARPDSTMEGKHIYDYRKMMGVELAKDSNVEADVVVPVPDSGVPAAMGYAAEARLPFEFGIIRNHYVGRTFIEPSDRVRHLGVKLKHNANVSVIKDKRAVLIDDSIVRGTTSKKIVSMVRDAGAKEVHMRISSPPTMHPCFYGVDTPDQDKLLAFQMNIEEMRKFIGADSLAFLSIEALYRAMGEVSRDEEFPQYCDACFTGDYPIKIKDSSSDVLPLFGSAG